MGLNQGLKVWPVSMRFLAPAGRCSNCIIWIKKQNKTNKKINEINKNMVCTLVGTVKRNSNGNFALFMDAQIGQINKSQRSFY